MANSVHIYEFRRLRRRRIRGRLVLQPELEPYLTLIITDQYLEENHDEAQKPTVTKTISNTSYISKRLLLPCILTHCCLLGVIVLCLLVMYEDILINIFDDIYQFLSSSVYCWANAMVVQGAITQFAAAFGFLELLMAATYNFTVKFLEMQWQVLHTVSNYATSICCWLLGNISRLVTLLDAHFPGGTIGCGIILLNSVVVIIVVTMFVKKKGRNYHMCAKHTTAERNRSKRKRIGKIKPQIRAGNADF